MKKTKLLSDNSHHLIEPRPNARIVRSALDEVTAIQRLLEDVYKDVGDGRTLLRELVQNADDAEAERLVFTVVEAGWPKAQNSLLQGPALVVANNGVFPAKDHDALHQALGGSKAEEAGKVGRFGIGLKSVFHICEAIVYVGADQGVLRPGALNPWAGTGPLGDDDPLHHDWDSVDDDDLDRLLGMARTLLGGFHNGLLQWIPLRQPSHLDRAEDRPHGLRLSCPKPGDVSAWFERLESLTLLLAQCGHLVSIEAGRAADPRRLKSRHKLAHVVRPNFQPRGWIGRYEEDTIPVSRPFEGRIEDGNRNWTVIGVEALGLDSLRRLRTESDWPRDAQWCDGRCGLVSRKALAHAAITVLRPGDSPSDRCGVRLRWAVFFPLDDGPGPNTVVEPVGCVHESDAWDIILHGYFWPSQDRRSIPGVTDDDAGIGDGAMRVRWNKAVCDKLLLPLLPTALANAVQGISEAAARSLLKAVSHSRIVQSHLLNVTRQHLLLPEVTENGIRWKAFSPEGLNVLSIPGWSEAPIGFHKHFLTRLEDRASDTVFIDRDAPRLGDAVGAWPLEWIEFLLDCISAEMFRTSQELLWIETLLLHLLGSPSMAADSRAAAVASWLASRIGEGALGTTAEGAATEVRTELRSNWLRVFAALPKAWLVSAPLATQLAVAELAKDGVIGAGLLPVPLGRNADMDRSSCPDAQRLDGALLKLGKRLLEDSKAPLLMRRSRLLLAEALLPARDAESLGEELSRLPLLRARRLPENRDEAWSIAHLRFRSEQHRVFARLDGDGDDNGSFLDAPSDPKQAVAELAEGIGEAMWLVDGAVASATRVPVPAVDALARAVLSADVIRSSPEQRLGLLQRLANPERAGDPVVRLAMIALLTGRIPAKGDDHELYYVRSHDHDRIANQKALGILLRILDKTWCAIEVSLIHPLRNELLDSLRVKVVDFGVLHMLVQESIDKSADWTSIERDEAILLLRSLHGNTPDTRRRWRQLPLHREVGGSRGSLDDRALRAVGGLQLPRELKSEVRLLEPDQEVNDLYLDVPTLDEARILHEMLVSQRPHQFADQIIRALHHGNDAHVVLPRDPVLDLLRNTAWLPLRDERSGVPPEMLLVLPSDELQSAASPLAMAGALGEYRLADDVVPSIWRNAKDVVLEILNQPIPSRQIQRLAKAIDSFKVVCVDGGAYSLLPKADGIDARLIEEVMQSTLADSHVGWAIVRSAAKAVGFDGANAFDGAPASARDAVVRIARALCGNVPAERQVLTIEILAAGRPAKESPTGRVFRRFVEAFAQTYAFFDQVLPKIELPTQDGQWHQAREIARSTSGVARCHRLLTELRDPLRLNIDEAVQVRSAPEGQIDSSTAGILTEYFGKWTNQLPGGAVGAFLALLGDGHDRAIFDLSQRWLGEDVSVEGMRRELDQGTGRDACASVRVFVSDHIASGQRVEALNLLNERVGMGAELEADTVFATDPVRESSNYGHYWKITLRDVEANLQTKDKLIELLGNTVEWWAVRVLLIEPQAVRSWWLKWGPGSQAQVVPVQASILAYLPLTLRQLGVHEHAALRNALQDAQRAQRRREQAPAAEMNEAIKTERLALGKLKSLIEDEPEHQRFIWTRVQELMKRYGYNEDSVLLELAQNADDALAQAAEIVGRALPPAARRLIVRVARHDEMPTVDVIHYGRPINDTGGAAFSDGRDRQWDQDLYFMMLLNLSGKPGETPGQGSVDSTTGRFGLGFKSVHLVSEAPSVVSGFLAFSIVAGLLPLQQPIPPDPDFLSSGHRATRVRLPLRDDKASELIEKMFHRFDYARVLLPAFAREIREVVVDGGPHAGTSTFDGAPIDGAPGWSVAKGTVGLPGHGQWRLLRFRPADAGRGMGTEALVIGLREGVPELFPAEVPFLWNVTPTSEGWGCGYAVNGPFKLDPGRTHVSLDDDGTRQVADFLGETLGGGLVKLHDALVTGGSEDAMGLPTGEDATEFLVSLWRVLAAGIDNRDEFRKRLLLRLHGPGRGLSFWMSARSVVPSGLPAPFPYRLPALEGDTQIEIAVGGLDTPGLCRAIAQVDDLVSLAQRHRVVSNDVAQRLRPLLRTAPRQLCPSDIFQELAERWEHVLTPERLHALCPLAEDSVWKAIPNDPQGPSWHSRLLVRSVAGSFVPLRSLLLPRSLAPVEADAAFGDELRKTVKDELGRAAFAPDARILDPAYIDCADDLKMFLRLRVRHEIDAATMASWYPDLPADRRPAALRYLLDGRLQNEVLELLVPPDTRPHWLDKHDEVRLMLDNLGEDHWRTRALLAALFPDLFRDQPDDTASEPIQPLSARRNFFERLEEWWNDQSERCRVIEAYEAKAWPDFLRREGIAEGLLADSLDHWLGLFVLGACRSLGWAQSGHHRAFLELVHREGWWEVFKTPEDTVAWMEMLRGWQDRAVADLTYPRWMSLFPAIYQLSRYLEKYRRLLRSAGRRPLELYRVTCLLAPRVDEALTGAGQHFDAPPAPLNMGLHWILRELVRLRILDGDHILSDCWVPSGQVLRFLRPLGMNPPDSNASNPEKAKAVFEFLAIELKTEKPHLHKTFDIPLVHIDTDAELRRQLGLEDY